MNSMCSLLPFILFFLISADAQGVLFQDESGATVLTCAGLKVWDADGKTLPAHFAPAGDGVRVFVDERGARYPITVDPTAQQAYLKASNPGTGDWFGSAVTSVGMSGDTVVVGTPLEDGSGTGVNPPSDELVTGAGAACVFVRNGVVWSQQAYLKASNTGADNYFGRSYVFAGFIQSDYGDAPVSYGPASHTYSGDPGFVLGDTVDDEAAQPFSVDAQGDDTAGADDESGVVAKSDPAKAIVPWQRGALTQLQVQVQLPAGITEARLDAWVDWDFTGTFIPALEQVLSDHRVHAGTNLIPVQVPLTAVSGLTFARYRLTRDGAASESGAAFSGEVEDYRITIVDPSPALTPAAYQRDGQVWITWDYDPARPAQVFEVYRSTNAAWNNVSQGTLIASLFHADYAARQLTDELTAAFGGAARTNFTIPHPNAANPPLTLPATKGLCVSTVGANGNFSYAVVPRGVTAITVANKTPLVAQVFNAANPPMPHLQQTGAVSGYPVTFYSTWADGGDPGDAPRPDFPFMANRNRNANASLFIVMEPPGGVPAGSPAPANVALHSGDGRAEMWLPGRPGFASAGMAPVNGYVICMEDKLVTMANGIPDATNTSWLGYAPQFDAMAMVTAYEGGFTGINPLPPNGAVIQTYTLTRLNWTLDWLIANRNIDAARVSMLGHSGGSKGALLWSHANPERFSSACLFGPGLGDFTRNPIIQALHGTAAQNLNTTLISRSGAPVPLADTVYLTRSLSPLRDTPPTRVYLGQLEENWVVDANADFLGDVIEDAKAADIAGNGVAFHWDQRQHGVDEWTLAAASVSLPACTFAPADFWVPEISSQARRDDAAYQSRYRAGQSYPAFCGVQNYANHGDIGVITYGGIPYEPGVHWIGPADVCRPKFPAHTGDRRGTWGGWFDWINNAAAPNAIVDTATQWGCTVFLAGSTGPDGQAHGLAEVSPQALLQTDVAIRRAQNFQPALSASLTWVSVLENTGAVQQSGAAVFDPDGVVRVNGVNVPRDPARLRLMVASQLDFGDAPACYPVTAAQNGARHIPMPGFTLGVAITQEAEGVSSPAAGADGASDDGVMLPGAFVAGDSVNIGINASAAGKVDAWIDWNADGDWTDGGEQVLTSRSVVAGAQAFSITAPADAVEGQTFARFRLSKAGGLTPAGGAADGEVEDYLARVTASPAGNPAPVESTNPADILRYTTNGAGDPVFQWLGRPGEMATLEISTDLVLWQTWFQVGAPAVTGPVEFPVPVLPNPHVFFRLIRTPLETSAVPCVPGLHLRMAFTHAGLRRTYSLYIPPQHPVSTCPLALILHGGGQSGPAFMEQRNGELAAAADTHGMILCFPDATEHDASGTSWFKHDEVAGQPYIDDQAFLDALVTHLLTVLNVDTHRLYAAGFSSGGQMTHYLGGRSTTNFAAFAACSTSVGSNVIGTPGITIAPAPSAPKPMLIINLRDDTSFPFFGSPDKLPAIDSVNHWALANGCPPPPAPTNTTTVGAIPHRVTTDNYLCPSAPVRFVAIETGGHIWPDEADNVGSNANVEVLAWLMTFTTP